MMLSFSLGRGGAESHTESNFDLHLTFSSKEEIIL